MIRLQNVTKVYDGGVVAVKDATLDIPRGEFIFLVGPSGSGKSTLIRLMMREERPTAGDIWVAGKHASKLPAWKVPHLRRSIGTVFQDFKLLPNKTVYENVAFALEVTGRARSVVRAQVPQVLKLVGLSTKADRYPRQLSGGEQQRVSIARAFVNRPLILLADEPTGNLDPGTSVGIMRILDRINRTGTTVVMATHDHAIVDAMRRRVVQLDRGRIMRDQSRGVYESHYAAPARRQARVAAVEAEAPVPSPPEAERPAARPAEVATPTPSSTIEPSTTPTAQPEADPAHVTAVEHLPGEQETPPHHSADVAPTDDTPATTEEVDAVAETTAVGAEMKPEAEAESAGDAGGDAEPLDGDVASFDPDGMSNPESEVV